MTPITLAAVQPFVIAITNALPVKSITDLITIATAKPKSVGYRSGGSGAGSHLGVELLQFKTGITLLHIAYKGSNPAIMATISGEVQMTLAGLATVVLPRARSGDARKRRTRCATFAESGVPGYAFDVWYRLAFAGAAASAIVDKMHAEIVRLLH